MLVCFLFASLQNFVFRGMMDESGEQFVAYFLPTEETMRKRKADFVEEVEYTPEQE